MTSVMDLDEGQEHAEYSLSPREAVLAAYAQGLGDYNSWNYESKYGSVVKKCKHGWCCGRFWAMDDFGEVKIND